MNYKIKNLCEITSSKRIFAKEYTDVGIPFFRSQEIISLAKMQKVTPTIFISKQKYSDIINKGLNVPSIGDILISAIGANRGYPWYVDFDNFYFKDGNVIWLRNFKDICNPKYIKYYLIQEKVIKYLQSISEHSAQGAITLNLIKDMEIYLPPKEKQQHIVNNIKEMRLCF